MEKEYSKTAYVIKFFAIFSVITAHVNIVNNDNIFSSLITNWYNLFGIVGVICFFIIGGYYYKRENGDTKKYWKKKAKSIIIPWMIAATISYILHVIKIKDISFIQYIKWITGSGTIYYYLTIYVIFLGIFKFLKKNDIFLVICIILNIIELILNTKGIFYTNDYITYYLNIFNWIGFFAIGILIRKYDIFSFLLKHKNIIMPISIFVSIILFIIMYNMKIWGYFHIISLLYEICGFIVIFYFSYYLRNCRILNYIGEISFFIYLYHIQIVQNICWKLPICIATEIINPIISVVIMVGIVYIGSKILGKINKNSIIYSLLGIRKTT